jgi:hypothetical protein
MKKQKTKTLNNKKIVFNEKGQLVVLNWFSSKKINKFYKCLLKKSL